MKKLCIVFILFITLFPNLNAQIFYNIEKPLSYQKSAITFVKDLPALNYTVDANGNCYIDKLFVNIKEYLKLEKIDGKNIARIKFNIASKSLGEMSLRFSDVHLKNGAYCYVYTTDYQIVAGPIYQKSINDMLNIVKIPANELVLEIVSNSELDYNLIFTSISFKSNENIKPKRKNSLQEVLTNWDCENYGIDGNPKYCDNISEAYTENSASYLGALYDCELLTLQNLYSVNDENIAASRASCIIMEPPHFDTETPPNWIDYWGANSGTLMNFPESDCEGIVFTSYHLSYIQQICSLTVKKNNGEISSEEQAILDNTIIRFNWHHKYGKPLHLSGCNQNDYQLWRKTIDFDEVIDYCGVSGVAFADARPQYGDFAILKMKQMPFYKELHLGWTTQRNFDYYNDNRDLTYPSYFSILGRHAATPTYLFRNSGIYVENMNDTPRWVNALILKVVDPSDPPLPPPPLPPLPPRERDFGGWSGSQLLYPCYENTNERIGLGITLKGSPTELKSYTYRDLFHMYNSVIIDTNRLLPPDPNKKTLYQKYLFQFQNDTSVFNIEDDFYWMPSVENKDKCPSNVGGGTVPCTFNLGSFISYSFDNGKLIVRLRFTPNILSEFPEGVMPKGIRIYQASGDQKTFYFDSFNDDLDINTTIEFTINRCDLFYFQAIGLNPLTMGFDFYDGEGKILNAPGCNETITIPLEPVSMCDAIDISTHRINGSPNASCCSYKVIIKINGCDDNSNIIRLMKENLSLENLSNSNSTPLSSQNGLSIDYIAGEISFIINDICATTSFKFIGLFNVNSECESFVFELNCVVPDPPCDCCEVYKCDFNREYIEVTDGNGFKHFNINPFTFVVHIKKNTSYTKYCPECLLTSVHITSIPPDVNVPTPPVFDFTLTRPTLGDDWSPLICMGSFQGVTPSTYCFNIAFNTSQGVCNKTICIYWSGSYWQVN